MGDHIVEYGRIFNYRNEILRTNPGSTCVVKVGDADETGKLIFQSFYVCLHALKKALFRGVRRLISLDGCFLKGVCKGQMLLAVCRDGNIKCCLLPGKLLRLRINLHEELKIAVKELLPLVEHRKCARHVLANWSKLWKESFNAWVLPARFKTIITMLEEIRVKMMKRIGELRQFLNTWITDISPMALKILQENIDKSMQCNLSWNGERVFEIVDRGCTHTIDIGHNKRTCPTRDQPGTIQLAGTSSQAQAEASTGRGRGRARGSGPSHAAGISYQQEATTIIASATRGRGRGEGRGKCSISGGSSVPNISSDRESSRKRERGMTQESQTSSSSGRSIGRGVPPQRQDHEDNSGGHTRPFKRPRIVGIGIYQDKDGFTTLNPGIPSRRVISTSAKVTKRSDIMTGYIGYTLR
ncbi:putative ADP-ribosylation factor GTPase-activating protein AGD14-like [Capsicum annuum]|nr:putative ADP-ribosylation factor GTPase-activating protein AGD14-like [Capsicum annuum]